jgi:cytochrome c oxidase assembly protein subunit 11
MTATPNPSDAQARGIRRTAILCGALVAAMVGAAYASVPLYDLFCRATGFGGTPLVGTNAPLAASDRTIAVRFDSNVAPGLRWRFTPETNEITARLGEPQTVMFKVTNTGPAPSTGVATFNVQPDLAGGYFVKIACFCFTEQTLKPGESLESAVVFYVDPDIAKDGNTRDIPAITLSYTYFPSKNGAPVTTAAAVGN